MFAKKLHLPKSIGKTLHINKMRELQIFVITNICKNIFVTFGRIGTWPPCMSVTFGHAAKMSQLNPNQGCQMVYFQTSFFTSFGTFRKAFEWKMFVSVMTI
jgi:hypothetical protein